MADAFIYLFLKYRFIYFNQRLINLQFHGIRLLRRLEQSPAGSEEGDAMKKSGLSMALVQVSARASPRPWWLSHLRTWALHRRTPEVLGLSESDGLQGQS